MLRKARCVVRAGFARAGGLGIVLLVSSGAAVAQVNSVFPTPAVPIENPITPAKVQLGKALFFEEQLSTDNTMACATCHMPEAGGADPRAGLVGPGLDGVIGTGDDTFGSPGMIRQDAAANFAADPVFGWQPQATSLNAPTVIGAAFFSRLFWDQRAFPQFRDEAGNLVISDHGALESVAVEPPLSSIEMAHLGNDWDSVVAKLSSVVPLALASEIPVSLADFVGGARSYRPLFARAFADGAITRERVAMAIATYMRTLIPDQSPFDTGRMTPSEQRGFVVFLTRGRCTQCHDVGNGLFSNGFSRSIGLPGNARSVKTPTLRNVGLRRRLMHNGEFANLDEAVTHYETVGFFFTVLSPKDRADVIAFLSTGLTDPRVRDALPPFDRPTLRSQRVPAGGELYGEGTPGSGGLVPRLLAHEPPNYQNADYKVGVADVLGGSPVLLALSTASASVRLPSGLRVHVDLDSSMLLPQVSPVGFGQVVTYPIPLTSSSQIGTEAFLQGFVLDGNAAGGLAATPGARVRVFQAGVPRSPVSIRRGETGVLPIR